MAKQPQQPPEERKPFDASNLADEIAVLTSTPLPDHQGLKRPDPYAPPQVRERQEAEQPKTFEQIKEAGKKAAEALAREYLGAAEAIMQTGREYQATQNKMAAALIDEARYLEDDGKVVMEEYARAAEQYRSKAVELSAGIELATGKSDKAIALCREMIEILAITERQS